MPNSPVNIHEKEPAIFTKKVPSNIKKN